MLTLFTFKKILFSLSVGSAVVGPVVATSPIIKEFNWSASSVSPMKEGLRDLTKVDIYDGESVGSFLKKALLHKEGQEGLVESFSQELAKGWYLSQPKEWITSQIKDWDELHEFQFQKAWETLRPQHPQRDFWDNYWGSKESMNSYGLRFKSHELVQTFLTDFKKSDFKINSQVNNGWDSELSNSNDWNKYFTSKHSFSTKEELENQTNWSKIGFYPTKVQSSENMWEKITLGKFEFINWVYKKWLSTKLPVYFWKISWNYDTEATEDKLKETYDLSELGNSSPKSANYEFPIFSAKTLSKFNEFIKKIKSSNGESGTQPVAQNGANSLDLKKYYIPSWYSDQSTSGEIIELFDAFENETPELASALSYLVNKHSSQTKNGTKKQNSDDSNNHINKVSSLSENYNDLAELFLEKEDKKEKSIEINSKLLKKNNQSKFAYDVRETDSDWLLFRDTKGVHAIQLDGYKNFKNNHSKNLTEWINFRNLQTYISEKSSLDYETLISTNADWFTIFSKFMKNNFDSLFSEYYVERGDKSLLFKDLTLHKYFDSYKETLKNLFAFKREQQFNSRIFNLRKKIIERYSGRDWELPGNLIAVNNPKVALKSGLSSVFPYEISANSNDSVRFPDQENILSIFSEQEEAQQLQQVQVDSNNIDPPKNTRLLSSLEKYYEEVQKLLNDSSIVLKTRTNGFNFADSQRIFIQDPIFDFLLDKLFSQKDFLNYIVKEEKLLNSSFFDKNKLLGEKSKLDPSSGWSALFKLPPKQEAANALQKASNDSSASVTPTCKYTIDNEQQKTELQKLFSLLIKNYLFRNYLKKLDSDYFNFWIDFANYKRPENGQQKDADQNQKLSDYELFSLWQNVSLTDIKNKTSLLDFLLTLDYLTKDKFENFKKFMTSQLSNKNKYHYLLFELKKVKDVDQKDRTSHPFLPTPQQNDSLTQKYFSSRKELRTSIRENWKPSDNYEPKKINSTTEDKGKDNEKNESFPLILHSLKTNQDIIPDKNKNLFNFSNLEGLIQYIKEIKSVRDLDLLVTQLSLINWKIYPSFYRADKIFYKQDVQGKKTTHQHQEKRMYLEDKKKVLIYQIKNKDQSIYASKIFSKDEIDKMFENNLLESNSTAPTATDGSQNGQSIFEGNLFTRQQGKTESGYFIQISQDDFSNDAKMCQLFEMLPGELLGEFIIQQTDNSINKQSAQDKFFEEIQKIKIHDLKFKGHLDNRYSA